MQNSSAIIDKQPPKSLANTHVVHLYCLQRTTKVVTNKEMSFLGEIQNFSKKSLKATNTTVTTMGGRQYLETRDKYGRTSRELVAEGEDLMYIGDTKPDLQVGEVLPGLLVASQDVAADINLLKQHKVTHILNVASRVENLFYDDFTYKRFDILDLPETNIVDYFDDSFEFIDTGRGKGCVLVHCNAGVSRSASIVIGYLMSREKMDFQAAYDHVKSKRPATRPNDGFLHQLRAYSS